jgi:WD40 repeat protein
MSHGAPHSPRKPLLCAPWLGGTLAAVVGLWAFGGRPAETAGPPEKREGKPGAAPLATRVFHIPAGAVEVKDQQRPDKPGSVYRVHAGGSLSVSGGSSLHFVEAGGEIYLGGGSQVAIVKRGGKAVVGSDTVDLFYEKGAQLISVTRARRAVAYDRITFRPFRPFTLRAAVTDPRGRAAAGVEVHAFGLGGRHLDTAWSAADGTVTFRPQEEVACLAADFGPRWEDGRPAGVPLALEFTQRMRALKGWEAALVNGSWAADALVRLAYPGEGPLQVRELRRLAGRRWGKGLVAFSPDGRLLACERDQDKVTVWDLATGAELATVGPPRRGLHALAFAPDGKAVAVGVADGTVHLWQTPGGKKLHTLIGHLGAPTCLGFSPDGRTLISGGEDSTVRTWDLATGRQRGRFKAHPAGVRSLAFSPDGKTLATGGVFAQSDRGITVHPPDRVRLWDPATGRELRNFPGHSAALAFSPDGRLLASGGVTPVVLRDNGILITGEDLIGLRDTTTGEELLRKGRVGDRVACTPDGHLLVTAKAGEARFWEVATGEEVLRVPLPVLSVWAPTFGPGARRLAVAGTDGTVHVWDLSWEGLYGHRPRTGREAWGRAWADLAGANAAAAYEGIRVLAAGGDRAAAFLGERLKPAPARQLPLGRLIADLDSPRFAAREKASRELKQLGAPAEAALREALGKQPPLEARLRIEAVLAALSRPALSPEELRQVRAIQALERVGTPAARRVLGSLAGGWPGARQTREARAALARLQPRAAQTP